MKLSIIVPVYNVEQYLRKCVESLIHQDFSDYEIILVDDGSTDGSGVLCDEIVRELKIEDRRLKNIQLRVIHQENRGLSAARNAGLKMAQGEYVCFVDSDDCWEENVLGGLMAQVEREKLDVLRYNYQNVRENGEVFVPFKTGKPYFDYRDDVLDGKAFLNERLGYACYAWAFIINRSVIIGDSKLKIGECLFKEGIYFEDTDWTPRMLMRAKRVSSTDRIVYNYLWREGSITLPDNPEKKKKVFEDRKKLLYGFLEQQTMVKDKRWFEWQIASLTLSLLGVISSKPHIERKKFIQELKATEIFPLSTYRADRNSRIKIRVANISPTLYCWLMSLRNR